MPSRKSWASLEGMAANRGMESIKLATRLGNCKLNISAQLVNTEKATKLLAEYAMQFLIWHSTGSEAFNGKSDFKRDAEYSDELANHVSAKAKAVLSDCFAGIEIETAAYVKPNPIAKLIKQYVSMGFSEVEAKAEAEKVQAILDAKTEVKPLTDEESV